MMITGMRSHHLPLIMILLSTLVPACKKSGLFQGAGTTNKLKVEVSNFNEIVLNDKINLILTYDSTELVTIEAGANLLNGIILNVRDNKLIINDNNKYKWSRNLDYTINVYVSRTNLDRITYYGAGNIRTTNTWKADSFTIDSWTGIGTIAMDLECNYAGLIIRMANADIRLKGKSKQTSIYCADYGTLALQEFESGIVTMNYRSIRSSTIYVTKQLDAEILYKGDVYYRGTPVVKSILNSTGKLIFLP
ncbi:MAG: DUF2807 domain-containing protein [Chitinophagaceae bacterium]|nr:MAG: DUF2807 domain-containing protein [Chitinophagaceae bacterium]